MAGASRISEPEICRLIFPPLGELCPIITVSKKQYRKKNNSPNHNAFLRLCRHFAFRRLFIKEIDGSHIIVACHLFYYSISRPTLYHPSPAYAPVQGSAWSPHLRCNRRTPFASRGGSLHIS